MPELDLSAAISAGRAAARAEAARMFGCEPGELATGVADVLDAVAIRAAAPLIERAVREQVAQEIEASVVAPLDRYGNCTCRAGITCHPHACHEAMNRVTSKADEDTWPVHIAGGVWNELDPLIRRHAASIARGVGSGKEAGA